MITLCTGCHARYRLDAAKVPARRIHVRCPACAAVFELDGARRGEPAPPPVEALETGPQYSAQGDLVLEPATPAVERATPAAPLPAATTAPVQTPSPMRPAAATATTELDEPRAGRRLRRDKTEMLARALVSDILVYNQAARDKALADGNLLETLGPEIKKSWELYKEKVGAEAATSTSYFRDALNEILADGRQVF